mgnify:CR=1 FL=1
MNFQLGDHLVTPRFGYTHHGIYSGNGRVIHYSGFADGRLTGPVEEVGIGEFGRDAAGNARKVSVRDYAERPWCRQRAVSRARKRMGESAYDLTSNNCEHFVQWCITGTHSSAQVDRAVPVAGGGLGAAAGAAGLGATGLAASSSLAGGAAAMNGLATVGAAVGGGAVAGIGVMGAVGGGGAALLVNNTLLKDDPQLEKKEREARSVGRKAAYAGAAAGTAGSIVAIGSAGTVAGLSATGITSGLAAIGAGSMATGIAATVAAPAVATAAIGYGGYKLYRWLTS